MSNMEDESQFATYGTPLKPLDDDEVVRKKPVPIEDQIVTDENGRRRFHGAFTGGFSAGFFNTAGSRDGWSPAHFKSSRSTRNETKEQKPSDFMDAEDMGEFGIAPQGLTTSSQFKNPTEIHQRKRKFQLEDQSTPIPGEPVLDQFLKPVRETIGSTLLRKMGWKPGQGIGPRISKVSKIKLKKSNRKMFSSGGEKSSELDEQDEEEVFLNQYKGFLFAPDDIDLKLANPKDNMFGIGYSGLDRSSVLSSGHINLFEPSLQIRDKHNKSVRIRGQAFGVGAYEEEDEDIYGRDDMSRYDFALDTGLGRGFGSRKSEPRKTSRWDKSDPGVEMIIEGFVKASILSSEVRKNFPPPTLPKNFIPKCGARKSRFNEISLQNSSNPSPSERKHILSQSRPEMEAKVLSIDSDLQLKKLLSSGVEKTALEMSSFQPFSRDKAKQTRYEKYLVCVKNSRHDALPLLQPKDMTEWEREKERVEFERAAMLYKPLVGTMGSKFVSAGSSEDVSSAKLDQDDNDSSKETKQAASMKMYGKLTREKEEWHPANILCIRFNVKHPYGDPSVVGVRKRTKRGNFQLFSTTEDEKGIKEQSTKDENVEVVAKDKPVEANKAQDPETDEVEGVEKKSKPSLDLFKSIFLDSSDSEAENETKDETREEGGVETRTADGPFQESEKSTKSSFLKAPIPAKGLFANIDFDALNKPIKVIEPQEKTNNQSERSSVIKATNDVIKEVDTQTFGPSKPPSLSESFRSPSLNESSEDSDEWEEQKSGSRPKSSKKKKHKKHKIKKKKSKKKKRRHSSTPSDD